MNLTYIANAQSIHTIKWVNFFVRAGHTVTVISNTQAKIEGAHVHYVELRSAQHRKSPLSRYLNLIADARVIRSEIFKSKPDIVHIHYLLAHWSYYLALRSIHPLLISIWGSDVVHDGRSTTWSERWIRKQLLQRADVLMATTQFLADKARTYTDRTFDIIPFGVDTQIFYPEQKNDQDITVGFFKSLKPKYGIKYLIKAFAIVVKTIPKAKVRIAGSGTEEEISNLKQLIKKDGLDQNISYLGFLSNGEVAHEMRKCDIIAMPSIYESEVFGVTAIEASATGLPVVASDIGGIPEAIQHNKTGILVPPKNAKKLSEALLNLINNPALRDTMGAAGVQFVKNNFLWERNAERVHDLYQKFKS